MVTKKEWLTRVREHAADLRSLILAVHPSAAPARRPRLPITARTAEAACDGIRDALRVQEDGLPHPVVRFDTALEAEDVGALWSLLQATWFGAPESESSWSVRGFSECVDLLEEPPSEEA